jgi:phosphatidylinositol alpha-1,6-mannosyltransferase
VRSRSAGARVKVLYLCTGVFDKGGISRYSRYEARALREILGAKNVVVHSLLAPGRDAFEEPIAVDRIGGGLSLASKARFALGALRDARRADLVIANHVRLAPLARLTGRPYWVHAYGLEIWSGLSRAQLAAPSASSPIASTRAAT